MLSDLHARGQPDRVREGDTEKPDRLFCWETEHRAQDRGGSQHQPGEREVVGGFRFEPEQAGTEDVGVEIQGGCIS